MSNPILEPVRPRATIQVTGKLYTCSPEGEPQVDLTKWLMGGTVTINQLGEIKSNLKVRLRKGAPTESIVDCLMPVMTVTWRDNRGVLHEVEEPLGVFYYLPPDEEFTENTTYRSIDGMDGLWRLSQLTAKKLLWFGEGKDYGEAAWESLHGLSPVPLDFPRTASGVVTPRTVLPNDYVLKAANDLYMAGDYWDLSANRTGTVSTSRRTVLGQSTPARIIDSRLRDVLGTMPIQRRPDRGAFCNQVFISSNSPEADLTLRNGYRVSLVDPDSPFNIYRSPIISRGIADSRDESFQTMRNRAIMILESAAGMQRRVTFPVFPDPRIESREAWQVSIFQNDGFAIMDGMARVEEVTYGFTSDSMAQLVTVSELANISQVVEGTVAA